MTKPSRDDWSSTYDTSLKALLKNLSKIHNSSFDLFQRQFSQWGCLQPVTVCARRPILRDRAVSGQHPRSEHDQPRMCRLLRFATFCHAHLEGYGITTPPPWFASSHPARCSLQRSDSTLEILVSAIAASSDYNQPTHHQGQKNTISCLQRFHYQKVVATCITMWRWYVPVDESLQYIVVKH